MSTVSEASFLEAWQRLQFPDGDMEEVSNEVLTVRSFEVFVIKHSPTFTQPKDLPEPTLRFRAESDVISCWWVAVPVHPHQTKAVNAWRMVQSMLCAAFEGELIQEMPNPMDYEYQARWTGALTDVTTMKRTLEKTHHRDRFFLEARQRGGSADTPAQAEAREKNWKKAQEASAKRRAAKADKAAREVLQLIQEGLTDAEMAERLELSERSLKTTVARARERMLPIDPELAKVQRPVEPVAPEPQAEVVSLENLVEMDWGTEKEPVDDFARSLARLNARACL